MLRKYINFIAPKINLAVPVKMTYDEGMAGSGDEFTGILEACLHAIGQGASVGDCLAKHPEFADKLRPYLETVVQMRVASASERLHPADIPIVISFETALNHSIEMVLRGKTPEYCYIQYPEHASRLQPWLITVKDVLQNGYIGQVQTLAFPSDLLTPEVTFQQALEYCLSALERGVQPEVILSRYPYYADRLRIWVYYISAIQPDPAAGQYATNTSSTITALNSARATPIAFSNLAASLMLAIVFFLGFTGLINAAAAALPGQSLYPLKRTIENVRYTVVSPADQDFLLDSYVGERYQEISAAVDSGQAVDLEFVGKVSDIYPDHVVIANFGPIYLQPGYKMPAIQAGAKVDIIIHADRKGVSTAAITIVDDSTAVAAHGINPTLTSPPVATTVQTAVALPVTELPISPTVFLVVSIPTAWPTEAPTEVEIAPTATELPTETATLFPSITPAPTGTDTPEPSETATPETVIPPTEISTATDQPATDQPATDQPATATAPVFALTDLP